MREFANARSDVSVDGGKLYLLSIFDWYSNDFVFFEQQPAARDFNNAGNDKAGLDKKVSNRQDLIVNYINRFRAPADQVDRNLSIEFIEYNEDINKQYDDQ